MSDPKSKTAAAKDGTPRTVTAADGASAVIHPHGAHITSWRPAGGDERLFLSRTADYRPQAAIRGGIPVIFPQFAAEGPLVRHGFARTALWREGESRQRGDGSGFSVWHLRHDAATQAVWPWAFEAELQLTVAAAALRVTLMIGNLDTRTFSFTAALHSYLAVADIAQVSVSGLEGLRYRDTAQGGVERHETAAALRIAGEVDRIYFDAPAAVTLHEPARQLRVAAEGFRDVVIWNPGAERGAALADLEPGGYARMLCIEAAVIGRPVRLAPGKRWHGTQILSA